MKRFLVWVATLALFAGIVYGVTESHSEGSRGGRSQDSAFRVVSITQTGAPPADFTEAINSIYGIVYRIVIDVTGTDGDYTITLRDENDITIFTKANLDSDPEKDFSYAVYEDDTEGNPWAGVPVAGAMDVIMADGDDDALTAITIKIYYIEFWK